MLANNQKLHYEVIEMRARPARIAVLADLSDPDWRHTALRIVEFLSSVWGGKHSLIIPTGGSTISPLFWTVLERFSPDYVFRYGKIGLDLKLSKPEVYDTYLKDAIREHQGGVGIVNEALAQRLDQELQEAWYRPLQLSNGLSAEICQRIVPFHFQSNIDPVTAHSVPEQLTAIEDILFDGQPQRWFTSVEVPDALEPLWWHSVTGRYSARLLRILNDEQAFQERKTANSREELSKWSKWITHDQLNSAMGVNRGDCTPFELTMSRVGFYGPPSRPGRQRVRSGSGRHA